jgi:hypothetical protein
VFAGRIKRLELEDQEVRERIDRTEGKARRDRISKLMLEKQQEKHLSRSEVLSMTRALELKMKIEDKVEARNALRKDLVAKKKESMERTLYIEETLRDGEVHMTTPRSLVRRRIVRRMHIAMQRQHNNFMICEWGCGDWFRGTYLLCWSWFPNCFTYQPTMTCSGQGADRPPAAPLRAPHHRLHAGLPAEAHRGVLAHPAHPQQALGC